MASRRRPRKELDYFRLGRLEAYRVRYRRGARPELDYLRGACGCRILTLWSFGLTWLSDECLNPVK